MILVNGQPEESLAVSDRGLQYGDGLFETIAMRQGQLEFLDAHLARLQTGCQRLAIPFNDWAILSQELNVLCRQHDAVVKVIITRGSGGRGYNPASCLSPTRIISVHPFPDYPPEQQTGVSIRLCQHRLASQPRFAGLKHLNRLDQIVARAEWQDTTIAEGLLFDQKEQLIEGTMSNVFLVNNDILLTPALDEAGVAGIMRAEIMSRAKALAIDVHIKPLGLDDLLSADEVFLCNSVIGIWPVVQLQHPATRWSYGPLTQALQMALQQRN